MFFRPREYRRHMSWTILRKHDRIKSHVNRIEEHDDKLTTRRLQFYRQDDSC